MSLPGQISGASATSALASATSTIADAASSFAEAKSIGAAMNVRHKQARVEHVWYGILGLLGLATVFNTLFLLWSIFRRRRPRHAPSTTIPRPSGRIALRRLPQAILSFYRIVSFRLRIPCIDMTVLELLLTTLYLGGCLLWSFAPRDNFPPRVNLKPESWAGNTAKLAAGQLPLAVVLALKNNPITWLTGIGHEKLVPVHRIVSRCIFVLTWLHLVGAYYRSPERFLNEGWKVAGLVGAVAQTITTIFGIKSIRRRYYELFYSTHVVLILIFLVTVHVHCIPVKFDMYLWAVWAIWGFDRLLRAGRYTLYNLILRSKDSKALVECIGADGLRVTLKRRIPGGWKAGQHAFLAFPKLGIESHPFTIGSVYEKGSDGEAEMAFIIRAMGGQTRTLMGLAEPSGFCELTALVDGPYGHPEDIRPFSTCVFIAGGTGVTYTIARMHQLFKDVLASDACATRIIFIWAVRTAAESDWILADLAKIVELCPKSVSLSVEIYVTAGRSNAAMPFLPTLGKVTDLAQALSRSRIALSERRTPISPRVDKEDDCNDEKTEGCFSDSQESGTCTPATSDADCFNSGASTPTVVACADGASSKLSLGRITRRSGRPDVRTILEEEVTTSSGAVSVDVSGPDGLVNAVRSALCQPFNGPVATLRGAPTVMLNVEQFRM